MCPHFVQTMREPSARIGRVIRHVIGIHCGAVGAIDRTAINQQVPAAVRSDMAEPHWLEFLGLWLVRQRSPV
jgi:hypothetical protein